MTLEPTQTNIFERLAKYPTYNVDDPKLDSKIAATYKSIAATNLPPANSGLDNPSSNSVLCAFCDEPLLGEPSDELVDLQEALEDETWSDPSRSL
jgi:hypothetical protein